MLREGSRHITEGGFFANISAVFAQQPMAGMAAYSASKAGIWGAMTGAARIVKAIIDGERDLPVEAFAV